MYLIPLAILLPMAMGAVCLTVSRRSPALRTLIASMAGVITLLLCVAVAFSGGKPLSVPGLCGAALTFRADGFRSVYACIAAFMWMMTGLFAPGYFRHHPQHQGRYSFFNLLTLGATLGVLFADDLMTAFVFFEIMSFTSFALVAHEETPGAMRAAYTYLAVAVIGGLTTLMGLFLLHHQLGTLSFDGMQQARAALADPSSVTTAAWLTLTGFAAKAGLFPLHVWLPKAHPVAPAPASALLSGILTKSGVFGLIVICARLMPGDAVFGNLLLIPALITMFLGALLALFSTDLKRTLACSSMSQIGFITVGLACMVLLGEHGSLAAYGTVMHMAGHSLIKLVLFMAAGVVYMNVHALDFNAIRGFGRKKPLLHIAFLLGALSIACVPPIGSGYHSKSLLHEALVELIAHAQSHGGFWQGYQAAEVLFLLSGGLTVAYMLKTYVCLFWEKNDDPEAFAVKQRYLPPLGLFALLGSAVVLPLLGALPQQLYLPLADLSASFFGQHAPGHAIAWYSRANLKGAAISIGTGVAVYLLIVRPLLMKKGENGRRAYVNRWPEKLDLEDAVYRPLLALLARVFGAVISFVCAIPDSKLVTVVIPQCVTAVVRFLSELPERVVMLLRRTLFSRSRPHRRVPVGNRFTYTLGCGLNALARGLNRTVLSARPMRTDFEFLLAASWRELTEDTHTLTMSVSFGLLLLCIGLLLTILYLL